MGCAGIYDLIGQRYIPQLLEEFQTKLIVEPISTAAYMQKITFEMTDSGIKASAATLFDGERTGRARRGADKGEIIKIDSPYTAALTKKIGGIEYLLFQIQIVDSSAMKILHDECRVRR